MMSGFFVGRRKRARGLSAERAFTLVEIIIVIVVIGILSSIAVAVYLKVTDKSKDDRRIADMRAMELALDAYYDAHDVYPSSDNQGPGGWDSTSDGDIAHLLITEGYLKKDALDPSDNTDATGGYRYYRYNAGAYGADASRGAFYVLGVRKTEASGYAAYPGSPGWSTPGRNWQGEFSWVTGRFEDH